MSDGGSAAQVQTGPHYLNRFDRNRPWIGWAAVMRAGIEGPYSQAAQPIIRPIVTGYRTATRSSLI
jgi:hypothetical protein